MVSLYTTRLQLMVVQKLSEFKRLTIEQDKIEKSAIRQNKFNTLQQQKEIQEKIDPSTQETPRETLSNDIKAIRWAIYQIQSKSGQVHSYKTPALGPVIGMADVVNIIGFNFHPLTPVLLKQTPWGGNRIRGPYTHSRDQFNELWTDANLQDRIGLVDQYGICQYTYDTTAFGQSVTMSKKIIPFEVDWQIHIPPELKDEWMITKSQPPTPCLPCPPCPKVTPLSGPPLYNPNHSRVGIPASQKSDQK